MVGNIYFFHKAQLVWHCSHFWSHNGTIAGCPLRSQFSAALCILEIAVKDSIVGNYANLSYANATLPRSAQPKFCKARHKS